MDMATTVKPARNHHKSAVGTPDEGQSEMRLRRALVSLIEKLIRYEAVHDIKGWPDVKNRLDDSDRRCYGFFHPRLPNEPLIFAEVAMVDRISEGITPLLDETAAAVPAAKATTAIWLGKSATLLLGKLDEPPPSGSSSVRCRRRPIACWRRWMRRNLRRLTTPPRASMRSRRSAIGCCKPPPNTSAARSPMASRSIR